MVFIHHTLSWLSMPRRTAQANESKERGSKIEPRFLIIGRIRKPHGVRGDLKVSILADEPKRFNSLERVFVSADSKAHSPLEQQVEKVRLLQSDAIVKFAGIDTPEVARTFNSQWLFVSAEDALQLAEGELYSYQLIGMEVVTNEGQRIGIIDQILETGANDVLVVQGEKGEILLPDIPDVVESIDIDSSIVIVNLLDGLIEE